MKLYRKSDERRRASVPYRPGFEREDYRSTWRRDYARLIHSPSFRRLQGKRQLIPIQESDFFRNRLTHSLEVAQIAKSIAIRLNSVESAFRTRPINTDIVEIASLAHDLGHPPFGHVGELALDDCMKDYGGFEGNAQTLRILSKLEKRQTLSYENDLPILVTTSGQDNRLGLNLTARTLSSILKYDHEIPQLSESRPNDGIIKGYYKTERDVVKFIKKSLAGTNDIPPGEFKTLECTIMDVADDIAYSTYDLEDLFKAGLLSPLSMIASSSDFLNTIAAKVESEIQGKFVDLNATDKKCDSEYVLSALLDIFGDIFTEQQVVTAEEHSEMDETLARAVISSEAFRTSMAVASKGYLRTDLTSQLVGRFIRGVGVNSGYKHPCFYRAYLELDTLKKVEILKHFTFESVIKSPILETVKRQGTGIIKAIFSEIESDRGYELLPEDFRLLYEQLDDSSEKKRVVCDFIAGMTDRQALEFHDRLFSTRSESIFKVFA